MHDDAPVEISLNDLLAEHLGISPGAFDASNLTDWGFIIQMHALIEGGVVHLLVKNFGDERLRDFFSEIDNSDTKRGRLAVARALELVSSADGRFISQLSWLRNQMAHKARNITKEIADVLGKDRRRNLSEAIEEIQKSPIRHADPSGSQGTMSAGDLMELNVRWGDCVHSRASPYDDN